MFRLKFKFVNNWRWLLIILNFIFLQFLSKKCYFILLFRKQCWFIENALELDAFRILCKFNYLKIIFRSLTEWRCRNILRQLLLIILENHFGQLIFVSFFESIFIYCINMRRYWRVLVNVGMQKLIVWLDSFIFIKKFRCDKFKSTHAFNWRNQNWLWVCFLTFICFFKLYKLSF